MSNTKVVFDINTLNLMRTFDNVTRAKLKDCIVEEDRIVFIVSENELSKAIGKNAANVKRLFEILKKKIKIVEFNPELIKLIKNFIHPLKVDSITEENGIVVIESSDSKTKGLLIGRAASNLRKLEEYIRRYIDVKEIKVV
ncbi:MAG: NusA-like transcription termination signal-binding factor [Nanoarchaeota archaeon]